MIFLTTHEKMVRFREERKITIALMARRIDVPACILGIVENGGVTHPNFVEKIKAGYRLTDEEAEMLLPECRRPSSPKYDPNHFVYEPPQSFTMRTLPTREEIDEYLVERIRFENPGQGTRIMAGRAM